MECARYGCAPGVPHCPMILTFDDQSAELPGYLERFRRLPVLSYDAASMTRRAATCSLDSAFDLRSARSLWSFDVFPPRCVQRCAEWTFAGRDMRVGDTIAQQIALPGAARMVPRVIVGVRVCEVFRTPHRVAFAYEALRGHPELGLTQFVVEDDGSGSKRFTVATWTRPRARIARLVAPALEERVHSLFLRAALSHFAAVCREASHS